MKRLFVILLVLCLVGAVPVSAEEVPAKSALLMDIGTGTVLYEQNAHQPLPP